MVRCDTVACRAAQKWPNGQHNWLPFWSSQQFPAGPVKQNKAYTGEELTEKYAFKDLGKKMELEDQTKSDLGLYLCKQPLVAFEKCSVRLEGNCDPYYNIWMDAERAVVKSCNNQSFAADARLRLESLKSGYNSALTRWAMDSMLDNCRDLWDGEQTWQEDSALDSVELLEVGEDAQDEENW